MTPGTEEYALHLHGKQVEARKQARAGMFSDLVAQSALLTYAQDERDEETGRVLVNSQSIRTRMHMAMLRIIKDMQRDVLTEVEALFKSQAAMDGYAMDASLADLAAALVSRLIDKWQPLFDRAAVGIAERMASATLQHSDRTLGASLRDVSKSLALRVSPVLQGKIDASTQEAVALIKRVPAEYLPNVQQDVMRSITTGNGLQDLVPALKERNVKVRNWADNVARDQTRKAYATINRERMEEAGVRKFKWVHSGGANQPRPHHLARWPAGLNGGVFSFDDPPIIDERTGERGFPGQAPYCGCTMSPVIDLED